MNTEQMTIRGNAHTRFRRELERQGPLHKRERELLLDAADALLFDEPEAADRRADALVLLASLEGAGRRTAAERLRLRNALQGCGAVLAPLAVAA
jgi:hypothetical protein